MKPQCNTSAECLHRVAEEHGAKLNYRQFNFSEEKYLHGFETMEQLQAFAQHYIDKLDGDELILAKFYGVSTKSELIIAQANHIQKLQSELPARGKQAALRKILEG